MEILNPPTTFRPAQTNLPILTRKQQTNQWGQQQNFVPSQQQGRAKGPCSAISFAILHESKNINYDYMFTTEIDLATNVWKIIATIMKNGCMVNIYKEGLVQMLTTLCLNANGLMSNYSIRVHPFSGIVKFVYVNHCTEKQVADFFRFPVNFCEITTKHIQEMVNRLDERFLGKILHITNEIKLTQILPVNIENKIRDQTPEYIDKIESRNSLFPLGSLTSIYAQNRALRDLRKHIINSTLKYSFISRDTETHRIRFVPDTNRRRQTQKQQKIVKHNIKIMPFCNDVKRVLSQYTPAHVLQVQMIGKNIDISWIEPTQDELPEIYDILRIDNFVVGGRILTPVVMHSIDSQVQIGIGGFAQISRISANISSLQENDNLEQINNGYMVKRITRQSLVRKYASKEKLFWEKSVIQHIGKGSCIFINKYYEPKLGIQSVGIEKSYLEESIFMEYCQEKSLNNYLSKMSSIMSMKVKIFLLYQVSVGLRYLRDFGVVHLDMKPENLLVKMASSVISSAFALVKIIDYGEAYCQLLLSKKMNRGHTCPYAPPELVRLSENNYTQKSDVFSIGVMILIIIFQLNIVDIKRLTSSVIFESNGDRYIKFYSICAQKCRYLGYEPQMQCLLNLAYKCINLSPASRPYLNWICVIFRSLLNMFDALEI